MSPLVPGYRVANGLVLVRHLGEGGMGTVWIAEHEKLGEVVVKFLSEELAGDADALARFEREATSMTKVKSPHVVQPLDHGITSDGTPYIVMELLEGEDLASTLRARGRLSPNEVMHVVDGVASALAKAHERHIVHRDIKPSNVFLCAATPRPFVKVVDFGISKRLGDPTLTATHGFIGTPAYMSPEQIAGTSVDARTDTWALGVLAYTALTGRLPFHGDNIASIVHAVTTASPARPTSLDPSLPVAVDAWAARALARDPDRRFASALELADALARALGESVRSRPASAAPPASFVVGATGTEGTQTFAGTGTTVLDSQPMPIRPRRSPWWAIAVVGAAVTASVVTFGFVRRHADAPPAPTAGASSVGAASATPAPPLEVAKPTSDAGVAPAPVASATAASTVAPRSHTPSKASRAGHERPAAPAPSSAGRPPDDIGF